jgi:RNA polymerase sigma factor (sigma-70 family)
MELLAPQPDLAQSHARLREALESAEARERLFAQIQVLLKSKVHPVGMAREEEAKELVQATLTVAWQSRDKYDGNRSPLGWLHGIASKLVLVRNRQARHWPKSLPEQMEFPDSADHAAVEKSIITQESMDRVRGDLTGSEWQLCQLRYFEGLSVEALAAQLKISYGAARVRLSRLYQRLESLGQKYVKEGHHAAQ